MALFPGQYNMAGGSWVDPSRLQTSQSGGAYIGGMTPQLPTQDMSFMWGGNGLGGGGLMQAPGAPSGGSMVAPGPVPPEAPGMSVTGSPAANPYMQQVDDLYAKWGKTGDMIDPEGRDFWTGQLAQGNDIAPAFNQAAAGTYQNMLDGQTSQYQPENAQGFQAMMAGVANGSIPGPNQFAGNSLDLAYGNGTPGSYAGGGAPVYGGTDSNPNQSAVADDMQRRVQEMLGQSFAGIRSNVVGTGGIGGSREAVAQGLAGQGAADSLAGQLANMYSQDWNASQNRGLQKYGMGLNYNLGNKNADNNFYLGNQGQMQSFYGQQRAQDMDALRLGASLYGLGNQGEWTGLQNFGNIAQPYSGYGQSSTTSTGPNWAQGVGNGLATYQYLSALPGQYGVGNAGGGVA